jgi:integrase
MPDPDGFRRTRGSGQRAKPIASTEAPKIQPDVASIAHAWTSAAYEDLRRGGPERADRVRQIIDTYLVPWFAPRTTTVADITYFMAHEWLLYLVGRERADGSDAPLGRSPSKTRRPTNGRAEVGLKEAAEISGVSLPTVRRRWRNGQLPGAYRDVHGQIRVPDTALGAIHSKWEKHPVALSQAVVADSLWVLRRVLSFARANGLFPPGFDPTEGLDAPTADAATARVRRSTRQPRPLTLPECTRIASHLHVVHQVAFWLQRIMGVRISEAFGVLVGDVIDLGDTGLLAVQGQGGRSFNVRDDNGVVVAVPHKETMKTAAGSRVLVVPTAMMELFRVAIEAFHTDPDTGAVDPTARLVPGLLKADRSGQIAYRRALDDAANDEHLGSADLGFRVSSHLLRKSLATDLAWQTGLEDAARRRFMGHRAGDDVFGRIYTLDHPELTPLVKIAAILDENITNSIGTLLTPTTRRVHWGVGNPLFPRADYVEATLQAANWLVDPGDADDPLCDPERVAAELRIVVTTARRWMVDGTVQSVSAPDAEGVPRRWSRLSDVWVVRDRLADRILLPDLAEAFGVRYHELYQSVRRLGLDLDQHPTSRQFEVNEEAVAILRAEHERMRALHERSMKLAVAARSLKLAVSTIGLLVKRGDLDVDPETDSSGARFIPRASVERYWVARGGAAQKTNQAVAAVPLAEVARFTGYSTADLMDLVHAGVLEQLSGRRRVELTATSLRAWMASRGDPFEDTKGGSPSTSRPAADGTVVALGGPTYAHFSN